MYRAQLKRVRRARQLVRSQRRQLLVLELDCLVGLTFHTLTQTLTVHLSPEAVVQVVEAVRADLRERQQVLKQQAATLKIEWQREQALKD
ncbi:hypothetical protein [Hymenobacter antarcticus]|uniref:Uncharacterized protein n=1 Tax=Hymenobacter antarcticus TaxID=486270 RepID=A0ABP7PR49_9BACT